MGIFSSIKDAIFGKDEAEKPAAPEPATKPAPKPAPSTPRPGATAARPVAVSQVDVEKRLDAKQGADRLNWRTSIVDLMKLLGIESSYGNRKELAQEMGRSDYSGSAEDNVWLHKRVMQELAKNGGKVPAGLAD